MIWLVLGRRSLYDSSLVYCVMIDPLSLPTATHIVYLSVRPNSLQIKQNLYSYWSLRLAVWIIRYTCLIPFNQKNYFHFSVPSPMPFPPHLGRANSSSPSANHVNNSFSYENVPSYTNEIYLTYPQSPRNRIKTFVGHQTSSTNTSSNNSSVETVREVPVGHSYAQHHDQLILDYQGGGEDLFSTSKTKEQLYVEAKDILNSIPIKEKSPPLSNGDSDRKPYVASSPVPSVTRRPPRSKHDRDPSSPMPEVR